MSDSNTFKICVLISGGGTTLKNLIKFRERGELDCEIAHVISNNANAGGLQFAETGNIPSTTISHKNYTNVSEFSEAIFEVCRSVQTDLVVMGGFLRRVKIPADFENRVINIHPSLIPAFCGKGHYGSKVHQGVIDYGCKISGCTVHFVDDHYDHGPIIAQETVQVSSNDSPSDLAQRVFEKECQLYPAVINSIANGLVSVSDRKVQCELKP
jgi:phosphoribosylglycinamide formyltransferase-1